MDEVCLYLHIGVACFVGVVGNASNNRVFSVSARDESFYHSLRVSGDNKIYLPIDDRLHLSGADYHDVSALCSVEHRISGEVKSETSLKSRHVDVFVGAFISLFSNKPSPADASSS